MNRLGRRELLGKAAAMAIPAVVPASALGRAGRPAPSERINVGVIGLGAMGRGHLGWCLADSAVQLMAVCEVDKIRRDEGQRSADAAYAAARGSGSYKGCAAYTDYRQMLARDDIDAVLIATPDHWHALQSVDAAKA
ncbi:MAG: gfo/Idh/MocA family oxidoreductase, partial [Armatimonadetes bacterium]|nr:gfo/Idh/MocA family oxidoreductase [Armatimonadota bacterium]